MMNSSQSPSIAALLHALQERLAPVSEAPALDAQVLLAYLLGRSRTWLLAHPEAGLTASQLAQVQDAARRLEAGEPLPYVLGVWEFYGLRFAVSPAVLIPRPETELLVEAALEWLRRPGVSPALLAADVGAGSGCIAVALAVHHPALRLLAVDRSLVALHVARANAAAHGVIERIAFLQSDLLGACQSRFDLICANLPYIPDNTPNLARSLGWEPQLALFGGPDGLELIRRLLSQAASRLLPGGRLLLEIETRQGAAVITLAQAAFPQAQVRLRQDLAGHDRLVVVDLD